MRLLDNLDKHDEHEAEHERIKRRRKEIARIYQEEEFKEEEEWRHYMN